MGATTGIDWTDSTWNPIRGCSKVSEGCRNCYAMSVATRFSGPGQPYEGLAKKVNGKPAWTNKVIVVRSHLEDPLRWQKPRRIFVNSMSDLFHEGVSDETLDEIFLIMSQAGRHIFQILTKRPERMRAYCRKYQSDPLTNVWLGTSVEDQAAADERIPHLLDTPAVVRFLSCEPLLGPVDLASYLWEEAGPAWAGKNVANPGIDWCIVGGESGTHHRPMHLDWARSLRDQCRAAGVPYFFKQIGGRTPKANGKALDGVEWCEFPQALAG